MPFPLFFKKFDWKLLVVVLAISALSLATFYKNGSRWEPIFDKQIIALCVGLVFLFLVSLFDYRIFKNYSLTSLIFYFASMIFLLVTLISPAIRGSKSWITFSGFAFQPSEFAKLAVLILLAKYFSQKHIEIYRVHHIFASAIYVAIPAILTILQPDLGSMLIYVALWLTMLFFAGIRRKHLLIIIMIGLTMAALAWFSVLRPYQRDRIVSFINPYIDPKGIGYNIIQAQKTLGSGQIIGTAFLPADKKLAVLVPEQYTDFAFSAFGQKFGIVGVIFLMSLILALLLRIGAIVSKTQNNFAKLYGLGLITIIGVHAFMNAGMNMGVLPITGIPFSFLSYGGSHLITLMIGLGIIESIKIRG